VSTVRLRRLLADHEKLRDYVRQHPRVKLIRAEGEPPEKYELEYHLRSLRRVNEDLTTVNNHLVEITLPGSYPRLPPQCRMLTPIFHPNIAPHAICIGDHWSAGEPLWAIVARIGEMIAYQTYNVKSPLNGEAARWIADHVKELPLDPVSLLPEERSTEKTEERVAAPASVDQRPAEIEPEALPVVELAEFQLPCPNCHALLRVRGVIPGKRVRCPKCQTIVTLPLQS
jgi:ubiquitin-protein ligase